MLSRDKVNDSEYSLPSEKCRNSQPEHKLGIIGIIDRRLMTAIPATVITPFNIWIFVHTESLDLPDGFSLGHATAFARIVPVKVILHG
jgi:hypothetical protein